MQYGHDASNRLVSITYPDSTTELFSYDAAGNLASYTNNRGQVRTFSYDAAERLVGMVWGTGASSAAFTLDAVGRVVSMTDRNGDVTSFSHDALDRLTGETRSTAGQAPLWGFHHGYDAVWGTGYPRGSRRRWRSMARPASGRCTTGSPPSRGASPRAGWTGWTG